MKQFGGRGKIALLVMCLLCLMAGSAFAASPAVDSPGSGTYDFALILSSLIAFFFRQFFNLLTLIEDGLVNIGQGNMDVPIFGSLYRAMKYAGMVDYQIPAGIEGQDMMVTNIVCHVCLKLTQSLKLLVVYMEENIQNGYFPGMVRNFMEYLDIELDKYTFYQAWRAFVTNLPSYKISELLVALFH